MVSKQQIILNYIANSRMISGVTYTEIIKMAYEISNGVGSYNSTQRGYWSGTFSKYSNGWATRLLTKHNGRYFINAKGLEKLNQLNKGK